MIFSELSNELNESVMQCPECGGAAYSDAVLAEKQDACYHKVRSRYKVWPSAYASGALVQCRKKGAANWGNKSKKESVAEGLNEMDKSAPQPGRDGRVSHSTYGSRDKKGSDYFKGKEAPGKAITAKQASKDALDILKKQGVAEEVEWGKAYIISFRRPGAPMPNRFGSMVSSKRETVEAIVDKFLKTGELDKDVRLDPYYSRLAQSGRLSKDMFNGFRFSISGPVDRQDWQRFGLAEDQLDEKCWDTHRQAGMKHKGDRMVPNCVPKESASPMIEPAVDEAIKLDAPQRRMGRDELQSYADRIKTGTKTKQDKFAPIIHGSNIKAITKDDNNTEWDLDDLAKQITTRPKAILGTNAKMEKSKTEGEIIYDLTLPALSGIVVDEENGDFVEITTCPGAGECQLFCYARKGGYVMFPASSMSAAQALNFLVNDPDGYMARVNQEIKTIKGKTDRAGVQLVVRWHDAGDFFSKQYLDLAYNVAESNPDVKFYAYTKMADVATGDKPKNFIINFSSGSKRGQEKKVEIHKAAGNVVKQGVTVPKDMFFDLIARDGNKLIKDAKGRTQFKDAAALNTFKDRLAQKYQVDPNSIITYDEMLRIPEGPKPKWNVIVQPGAGDRAANRIDVIDSYLMFH